MKCTPALLSLAQEVHVACDFLASMRMCLFEMIECEHSRCQAAIDALGEEVAMRDMEIINLMEHFREKMLNLSHRHWTLQR